MPGLVVFGRRWSVGSDDLIVPALFLIIVHSAWIIALIVTITTANFDSGQECSTALRWIVLSYLVLLSGCILMEGIIAFVSTRGTIIISSPRDSMHLLLYIRLGLLFMEIAWVVLSIIWLFNNYGKCEPKSAMKAVLGLVICCLIVTLSSVLAIWCTFDIAGRKWLRMKQFQESLRAKRVPSTHRFRLSGNSRRNWRHRKAVRAYEESWDRRLRILCCCLKRKRRNNNSISEIAHLFTEFFRDLDVVPSDVIVGFLLLRRHQKMRMKYLVSQEGNDIYQFLSGISITPRTKFLSLRQTDVTDHFNLVIHYMKFALAAYGWPMLMVSQGGLGICRIMPRLSCFCCVPCTSGSEKNGEMIADNCCYCNYVATRRLINLGPHDVIYATYQSDVGKSPFYVAVDHLHRKVVVTVRGTLSLQDLLTDLNADSDPIPVEVEREDWYGHKGVIQSAVYLKKKLFEENLLAKAFGSDLDKGTNSYGLVLTGHSLGAGVAAILAVLLRKQFPGLECFAYAPPGGLLSLACMEDTKDFITTVVLGKDVIPRIGLYQMELLRTDLINVIKLSQETKWKIIAQKLLCCCLPESIFSSMGMDEIKSHLDHMKRDVTAHPLNSEIGLSAHPPLFPPGRIIHIVRQHPKDERKSWCNNVKPVYQAIWADCKDFDEVLISPTMISDHLPDNMLEALEKTLENVGPSKPMRILTECERQNLLENATPLSSGGMSPDKTLVEMFPDHVIPDDTILRVTSTESRFHDSSLTRDIPTDNVIYGDDKVTKEPQKLRLCLDYSISDFVGLHNAPLATPEALSASSSMVGISRSGSTFGTCERLILTGEIARGNRSNIRKSELSTLLPSCSDRTNLPDSRQQPAVVTAVVEITPGADPINVTDGRDVTSDYNLAGEPHKSPSVVSPSRESMKYIDDTSGTQSPDISDGRIQATPPISRIHQSVKSSHKSSSENSPGSPRRYYHQPLKHTESDSFLKHLAKQMTMHRSKQEDNIVHLTRAGPLPECSDHDHGHENHDDYLTRDSLHVDDDVKMPMSRSENVISFPLDVKSNGVA